MCTPPADIFGLLEETKDENVKEEKEEEPEEEQEEEDTSSPKGKRKQTIMNQIHGIHYVKMSEDLKEPNLREVQQFVDWGKSQDFAENATFYTLLPVSRRSLQRMYLEHLK